ncbi:MAG: DUF4911 domain-containing protein [Bdellovibrionales bacterium]|nr:DUF4911 domain-containing protein [Bdellovibrionales bacterium]
MDFPWDQIDGCTWALYLEIAHRDIVLLHAVFESHDSVAVVKTLDEKTPVLCLLTTQSQVGLVEELLLGIISEIPWRLAKRPEDMSEIFYYQYQYMR